MKKYGNEEKNVDEKSKKIFVVMCFVNKFFVFYVIVDLKVYI